MDKLLSLCDVEDKITSPFHLSETIIYLFKVLSVLIKTLISLQVAWTAMTAFPAV